MRGSTAVSVNTCVIFFLLSSDRALHVALMCKCFVRISCQVEREEEKKWEFFFFFFPAGQQMSEFMFY